MISLYIAWGKKFVVLLDSDKAGVDEKQRYINDFGAIIHNKIFTFGDIDNSWANVKMEDLIETKDKLQIVQQINPDAKVTRKKKLYLALQENLINKKYIKLSTNTSTKNNFLKIFDFLEAKIK